MENISQIVDMLEIEIAKDKSNKDELEQMKTLNDSCEEVIKFAVDINTIIENKENILVLSDTIDKDIAIQVAKKLELYQQKNLIDLDEYKNTIKFVNNLFNKIVNKNNQIKDKINELTKK